MSESDWFRNIRWNPEIEDAFFKKLARARDKSQYLRIQASTLASRHPEVALRLLDQYFTLGERWDIAQAHVDQATAYICLNQIDSAVRAYEAALARETKFPTPMTRAYLELPVIIAKQKLSQHYNKAISLLEKHKNEPRFPADRFSWNCALALILSEQGKRRLAHEAARRALAAASESHSGIKRHPDIGLVGEVDEELRRRLKEMAA